jgi:PQQ-dependent catabolism-associated CXXCW motif protein
MVALIAMLANCAPTNWQTAQLSASYDGETADFGVASTSAIHTGQMEEPTPLRIAGARTITTVQLRDMMLASPSPVLVDVLDGNQTESLPGAVWLRGAGHGNGLHDWVQRQLETRLAALTGGDKAKPIVFFCLSKTCWLSHNATVRAVAAGYTSVYWYRGGRDAWKAAGLAMEPVTASAL